MVAPLDWGLGHASRCIPIIRHLISLDCEVVIAADMQHHRLFQLEFPGISILNLPGYQLKFGTSRGATISRIMLQIPAILRSIRREKLWLKSYLESQQLDAVISDNRYGLQHPHIASIFITHQLTIKTPFGTAADGMLRSLNQRFIRRFDAAWVPDYAGEANLSGALSHPARVPGLEVKYLGQLTRFEAPFKTATTEQLLILLSGPEPQRSIFEEKLLQQIADYPHRVLLVRGLPADIVQPNMQKDNLAIFNHLDTTRMRAAIDDATMIISRSGYSTIMDLLGRGKKCIFVPTPGQSEQEYLAKYLSGKNYCLAFSQETFDLKKALQQSQQGETKPFRHDPVTQYRAVVNEFIASLPSTSISGV